MSRHEQGSVLGLLCEGEELLTERVCRLQLGTHMVILPESTQYREKILRIVEVCTEVLRTCVGFYNLRCPVAFGSNERRSQGNVQIHFMLETLRGLGERYKQ